MARANPPCWPVLAGLVAPDSGTLMLDGVLAGPCIAPRNWRAAGPICRNRVEWPIALERLVALGSTPQLPAFGGLPPPLAEAVTKALADFDLSARREQPATTLSGGELARAMLARATVAEPEILIVDEPVTGLDLRHATTMRSVRFMPRLAGW